jgi:hypothetical protein
MTTKNALQVYWRRYGLIQGSTPELACGDSEKKPHNLKPSWSPGSDLNPGLPECGAQCQVVGHDIPWRQERRDCGLF